MKSSSHIIEYWKRDSGLLSYFGVNKVLKGLSFMIPELFSKHFFLLGSQLMSFSCFIYFQNNEMINKTQLLLINGLYLFLFFTLFGIRQVSTPKLSAPLVFTYSCISSLNIPLEIIKIYYFIGKNNEISIVKMIIQSMTCFTIWHQLEYIKNRKIFKLFVLEREGLFSLGLFQILYHFSEKLQKFISQIDIKSVDLVMKSFLIVLVFLSIFAVLSNPKIKFIKKFYTFLHCIITPILFSLYLDSSYGHNEFCEIGFILMQYYVLQYFVYCKVSKKLIIKQTILKMIGLYALSALNFLINVNEILFWKCFIIVITISDLAFIIRKSKRMSQSEKFNGKKVLITGGAAGIGKLMSQYSLERGAEVIIWDINQEKINETVNELSKIGKIVGYSVDVSNFNQVKESAKKVKEIHGKIDILINNAGIVIGKYFHEHTNRDIQRTMDINAVAPMNITLEFISEMIQENWGHICNIASSAGLISNPKMSVYCSSKWSVMGWSESLRLEMEQLKKEIHVTTVTPYYINTGMFDGVKSIIPILNPEYAARKIINSIEKNVSVLSMPWSYNFVRIAQGLMPIWFFDFFVGKILGVYSGMDKFKGH